MKTLYVEMKGGLGNQLFQYAAALYMKELYGFDLIRCDLSWLDAYQNVPGITPRQFELEPFGGKTGKAPDTAIALPEESTDLSGKFSYVHGLLHDDFRISGHFQQNGYVQEIVRRRLQEKVTAPRKMFMWDRYPELQGHCISVHIRRGDYVTNPTAAAYHGVLPPSYYQEAIRRAADGLNYPCICIFTDDVPHVRENVGVYVPDELFEEVSIFDTNALETLACMCWCDAHVIANSSFSWWGAKLGIPEAMVIYPKQWNRNSEVPAGLMPEEWIGL